MKQEALRHFQYGDLSAVAMLLFLGVFLGFLYFVMKKTNSEYFESMSKLPVDNKEGI